MYFDGGITGRRLRGYEVDQLLDHLGLKGLKDKEQYFKDIEQQLKQLNNALEEHHKQKDQI